MSRSINEVIDAVHSNNFVADNVKFHESIYDLNETGQRYVVTKDLILILKFFFQIF